MSNTPTPAKAGVRLADLVRVMKEEPAIYAIYNELTQSVYLGQYPRPIHWKPWTSSLVRQDARWHRARDAERSYPVLPILCRCSYLSTGRLEGDGSRNFDAILAGLADGSITATRSMFGPLLWRTTEGASIGVELGGTLTADTSYTMATCHG